MTKTLTETPKVGEKVRYSGEETYGFMTTGNIYEVVPAEDDGFGSSFRTTTDNEGSCGWDSDEFCDFELVTEYIEAPQPDVTDLIANLGRRLHEVETAMAPKEIEVAGLSASYPKYFKDVSGINSIDVYKTHELFGIDDPSGAIQHASKKLLLSGARTGGKSKFTDIKEARDTLSRWLEINAMEAEAGE